MSSHRYFTARVQILKFNKVLDCLDFERIGGGPESTRDLAGRAVRVRD